MVSGERRYLDDLEPVITRVYVPTEWARQQLYVYRLSTERDEGRLVIESTGIGDHAFVDGSVWFKSGHYGAVRLFSSAEIGSLIGNAEWYLAQPEEIDQVGFGRERSGQASVLVTRGMLPNQYSIWVPKVAGVVEEDERKVTGFERARVARVDGLAINLLHQSLDKFVRIVVETKEGGGYEVVGVQGAVVLK